MLTENFVAEMITVPSVVSVQPSRATLTVVGFVVMPGVPAPVRPTDGLIEPVTVSHVNA
jgi:hypothetical protein